jgi:hypothetical protein
MSIQLVAVRNFCSQESANVCKAYLDANGVRAVIVTSNFPSEIPDLPMGRMGQVELLVFESDLVPALAFLQLADILSGRKKTDVTIETGRTGPISFLCEFCESEIIYVPGDSTIIDCPNCLEYVDVPESS